MMRRRPFVVPELPSFIHLVDKCGAGASNIVEIGDDMCAIYVEEKVR